MGEVVSDGREMVGERLGSKQGRRLSRKEGRKMGDKQRSYQCGVR